MEAVDDLNHEVMQREEQHDAGLDNVIHKLEAVQDLRASM